MYTISISTLWRAVTYRTFAIVKNIGPWNFVISVLMPNCRTLLISILGYRFTWIIACSRLSISGSERKQRRAKNQAIQGERAGARGLWEGRRPSSFFPRSPAALRTDPLTEGLEQATRITDIGCCKIRLSYLHEIGCRKIYRQNVQVPVVSAKMGAK